MNIHKYPFHKLSSIHGQNIRIVTQIINEITNFVNNDEFYKKEQNHYFKYTLNFILIQANFLMKYNNNCDIFEKLLGILKKIIYRLKIVQYNTDILLIYDYDIKRILSVILKLSESTQPIKITLLIYKNIVELLEISNTNTSKIVNIFPEMFKLLKSKNETMDLCKLVLELLQRAPYIMEEFSYQIEEFKNVFIFYITQEMDVEKVSQMLIYLERTFHAVNCHDKVKNLIMSTMIPLTNKICIFFDVTVLKSFAIEFLVMIIFHTKKFTLFKKESHVILKEIYSLPSSYKQWPESKTDVFFVISYILLLHSKYLWSNKILAQSLQDYLSSGALVKCEIPKVIIALLSTCHNLILNNCNILNYFNNYKSICKYIDFTFAPTLIWILTKGSTFLKFRVINGWLQNEISDDNIVKIVDSTKTGYVFVQWIVTYHKSHNAIRMSVIISKLKDEIQFRKSLHKAVPQICVVPQILQKLLEAHVTPPENYYEIKNIIAVILIAMPFFNEDNYIECGCKYVLNLFLSKNKRIVIFMDGQNLELCIKCLLKDINTRKESTSLAILSLLILLVSGKYIFTENMSNQKKINVPFSKIIQGSCEVIKAGVNFLREFLTYPNSFIFTMRQAELLETYKQLHSQLKSEISPRVFEVLRMMLQTEPQLVCWFMTPFILTDVAFHNFEHVDKTPFLNFLKKWNECSFLFPISPVTKAKLQPLIKNYLM